MTKSKKLWSKLILMTEIVVYILNLYGKYGKNYSHDDPIPGHWVLTDIYIDLHALVRENSRYMISL